MSALGRGHLELRHRRAFQIDMHVLGDVRVGLQLVLTGVSRILTEPESIGTCSSDRRFKKGITPFDPVLDQLTALTTGALLLARCGLSLSKHFGTSRAYGLIAQDVEQVLPDLVIADDEGFKAVDYAPLPLLTIQAVQGT